MGLLPEVQETRLLDLVQQSVVLRRKSRARAGDGRGCCTDPKDALRGGDCLQKHSAREAAGGHYFQYPEIGGMGTRTRRVVIWAAVAVALGVVAVALIVRTRHASVTLTE